MTLAVDDIVKQVKSFSSAEKEKLYTSLLEDPEIRDDLLDYLLVLQAEAEGGEPVTLNDFLAGKRTYA